MAEVNPISLVAPVDRWAKYTIERFQKELRKKRIGVTNSLFRSFAHEIKQSGGSVDEVILKFNFYGRFRDMGVGRGLKAHQVHSNRANLVGARTYGARVSYTRRQAKRWYNKVKTAQIYKLKEILIEELGEQAVNTLEANFPQTISVTI